MPQIQGPDGRTHVIPGVYSTTRVRSSLPGPLVEFLVPVILGQADEGIPFRWDGSLKQTDEPEQGGFQYLSTDGAVGEAFGPESELRQAMAWAKRHGLPGAYVGALNALTRASIEVQSTGPVDEYTLYAKKAGYPSNWIKLQALADGVWEFTPLKHYTRILADKADGVFRIVVRDNSWIRIGATIHVGSNTVDSETAVVLDKGDVLDSNGQIEQYIIVDTDISAVAVTDYAVVFQYDETGKETITPVDTDTDSIVDAINQQSDLFWAVADGSASGSAAISLAGATALIEISAWGTATAGASPALTATDSDAWITWMNQGGFQDFAIRYRQLPRAYFVVSSVADVHTDFSDYAIVQRQLDLPISVTFGTAWGESAAAIATRTAALDNEDIHLCVGGLDSIASYISMAAAVFGRMVEGGNLHNLTSDPLQYATVEKKWTRTELKSLHRAGAVAYRLQLSGAFRFVVSQGLNTLQDNAGPIWNETTSKTWSIMQRNIADFVARQLADDLYRSELGDDVVTPNSISTVLIRRADRSLERRGYIVPGSYAIESIAVNEAGSGYDIEHRYKFPTLSDYLTVRNTIVIGD